MGLFGANVLDKHCDEQLLTKREAFNYELELVCSYLYKACIYFMVLFFLNYEVFH